MVAKEEHIHLNAVKVIRYLFSKKYGKDTIFFVHISITCISGSNKNLFWALTDFSDTKQDICHL